MTVLVVVETLLLVVLLVLVTGLLRSHAEILRRLGPADEGDLSAGAGVPEPPDREPAALAPDVAGATLEGDAVKLSLATGGGPTLLAFLGSGCQSCGGLWGELAEGPALPGRARVVVVTKDSSHESPSRLEELAPSGVPLIMSSAAWRDYEVPGSPYFVLVDGSTGQIQGEGAATGWDQIASLMRDAARDADLSDRRAARTSSERSARAEQALSVAGIGPGHPSLYPGDHQDERT
ncbi:MAG: hypothetical protein QOK31_392 [Solirubrobacteraceae bacterium]|jgi:hypothetical protein|nr:hypothetical protein [Solirubrobacteraceae bacterium]